MSRIVYPVCLLAGLCLLTATANPAQAQRKRVAPPVQADTQATTGSIEVIPPPVKPKVTLDVLDRGLALEHYLQPPELKAPALTGITLMRSRSQGPQMTQERGGDQADRIRQALTGNYLKFDFQIDAPPQWTLVNVAQGQLLEVTEADGQTVPNPAIEGLPTSGTQFLVSWAQPTVMSERHASLSLLCAPPRESRGTLRCVRASFVVTLGMAESETVGDVRPKVGQALLDPARVPDLDLRVEQVTSDTLVLKATGQVERIGTVSVLDASGQVLSAYGIQEDRQAESWTCTYLFADLPGQLDLKLDYFSAVRPQTVLFTQENVPLP